MNVRSMSKVGKHLSTWPPVLVVLILLIGLGLGAGLVIFTQTFTLPSGTAQVVSSTCYGSTVTTTAIIITGSSGKARFSCGAEPGFTTIAGTATPTFQLTDTITGVGYVTQGGSCYSATPLTDGSSTGFTAGSWDYCLSYANYPAVAPHFTVTWSQ